MAIRMLVEVYVYAEGLNTLVDADDALEAVQKSICAARQAGVMPNAKEATFLVYRTDVPGELSHTFRVPLDAQVEPTINASGVILNAVNPEEFKRAFEGTPLGAHDAGEEAMHTPPEESHPTE